MTALTDLARVPGPGYFDDMQVKDTKYDAVAERWGRSGTDMEAYTPSDEFDESRAP